MVNDKKKYLEQLKALHKKKFGKDITDAEALILFERLILLVRSVYKPMVKNK